MYSKIKLAQKYLCYWLTANNGKGHGTHSPFIYDFIRQVLIDKTSYPEYERIEQIRKKLRKNNRTILVEDFAVELRVRTTQERKVSDICKTMAKPTKFAQLLFRIIQYYKSQYILELGTSLGITTSYLALANPYAKVITCEENNAIATIAQQNFSSLSLKNIDLILGNFDNTLQDTLNKIHQIDFIHISDILSIFQYWQTLYSKAHNQTLFIFDNIHRSKEIEEAWKTIQQSPLVTCTIDLFFIGIISIQQEIKEPVHLRIRY